MNHNCAKGNEEVRRVSGKFISLGSVTGSKLSKVITPWLYEMHVLERLDLLYFDKLFVLQVEIIIWENVLSST